VKPTVLCGWERNSQSMPTAELMHAVEASLNRAEVAIEHFWSDPAEQGFRICTSSCSTRWSLTFALLPRRIRRATGDVGAEILRCAEEVDSDMVVMSTHCCYRTHPTRSLMPELDQLVATSCFFAAGQTSSSCGLMTCPP
jgi:hypothetical protein